MMRLAAALNASSGSVVTTPAAISQAFNDHSLVSILASAEAKYTQYSAANGNNTRVSINNPGSGSTGICLRNRP